MWWRALMWCVRLCGGAQVEITRLSNQEYFGERALIKEEPRKATIRAVGNTPITVL
jgi:CRP-like cAMP-binding protein